MHKENAVREHSASCRSPPEDGAEPQGAVLHGILLHVLWKVSYWSHT